MHVYEHKTMKHSLNWTFRCDDESIYQIYIRVSLLPLSKLPQITQTNIELGWICHFNGYVIVQFQTFWQYYWKTSHCKWPIQPRDFVGLAILIIIWAKLADIFKPCHHITMSISNCIFMDGNPVMHHYFKFTQISWMLWRPYIQV